MTFTPERKIKRGLFEVLVDRDLTSQEIRVSVYKGETLMAIDWIKPLDAIIDNLVAQAERLAPSFPNGERS